MSLKSPFPSSDDAAIADPEFQKMLSGQLYHAFTPTFVSLRARCSRACDAFNTRSPSSSRLERINLLNDILSCPPLPPDTPDSSLEGQPWVEPPFHCDYGLNIRVGRDVFINWNFVVVDTAKVTIGDRTLIGPNVSLYTGGHPLEKEVRNGMSGPEFGKGISIGSDCWIGGDVVVLPGTTIGDGAVVGAGSVVTKDVEPDTVVVGNPARCLKKLRVEGGAISKNDERNKVENPNENKKEGMEDLARRMAALEEEMRLVKEKMNSLMHGRP